MRTEDQVAYTIGAIMIFGIVSAAIMGVGSVVVAVRASRQTDKAATVRRSAPRLFLSGLAFIAVSIYCVTSFFGA